MTAKNWQPFQLNLPIVSIRDLHIRDNMLIAATHGRSFWMIDDLTPLQELDASIAQKDFYLFKSKDSYRLAQNSHWESSNTKLVGENHAHGVLFHYFLKSIQEEDEVKLEILEMDGDVVRTFSNQSKDKNQKLSPRKGGNRFVWDLRYPGFKEFDGMVLYSSPNRGPRAVPGTYRARLNVNGDYMEQTFEILPDPRLPNTQEDYQKQFDFLMATRDKVSEAHQAIIDIRKLRNDLDYIKEKLQENPDNQGLLDQIKALNEQMSTIETNIHETKNQSYQDPLNFGIKVNNHLAFLLTDQQRGDFPPTDQAYEVKTQLETTLNQELKALETLLAEAVPKLNNAVMEKGIGILANPRAKKKP